MVGMYKGLAGGGCAIRIALIDKYPNHAAFKHVQEQCGGGVDFLKDPVDATEVPPHLSGLRILFPSLHHFPPERARLTCKMRWISDVP